MGPISIYLALRGRSSSFLVLSPSSSAFVFTPRLLCGITCLSLPLFPTFPLSSSPLPRFLSWICKFQSPLASSASLRTCELTRNRRSPKRILGPCSRLSATISKESQRRSREKSRSSLASSNFDKQRVRRASGGWREANEMKFMKKLTRRDHCSLKGSSAVRLNG